MNLGGTRKRLKTLRFQTPNSVLQNWRPIPKVDLSEKLHKRCFGPYQALQQLSVITYEVQVFDTSTRCRRIKDVIHVLRMKPYYDTNEQTQILDNSTPSIVPNSRGSSPTYTSRYHIKSIKDQ
ncbi:hypothetical protein AVEN_162381-1 [Araneus ventricosus]|uniref:Integrase p58-like C-terminal domain-containing protein n=1 Tax=Araneus ventricosus TaxID=182803 RepID=A0A4Y2GGA5_ARAVE|nr:hypothetical protein AVEN_162381-1 [Araneus ventricosus]